ncbi:hypothetical protein GPLA_2388 [Paraglaciecola polaris LMG 21857]|uniref:Uncharacterized protein n=1 Tax=Paraglaciecola polaris LMG 21857 TaxID=1129793 RepID=K6ZX23_9ALTE|nr:hypothetical protein GPLA_2388 [Paraglaciecola polaris LMG 21857]
MIAVCIKQVETSFENDRIMEIKTLASQHGFSFFTIKAIDVA